MAKKKPVKKILPKKHTSSVVSFRVAGVSREVLEGDVQEIVSTLGLRRKFTLSDFMAIMTGQCRLEIKKRILRGEIPIADDI